MRQTHPKFRWLEALPSAKSTDGLTFSSSFLFIEEVKDEIQNSFGLCCLYIQHFPKFIIFIEEFASRVLNTIFLFSQLTQLEHTNNLNTERLVEFLEKYITEKYRNKLIILDNASAHKNDIIRNLVNKHNKLLYSVPYQHFSNAIENYFSMLKSKLHKLNGLKYENLKENIVKAIDLIPKEYYKNILEGAYNRKEKYVPKNRTRKNPNKIYL